MKHSASSVLIALVCASAMGSAQVFSQESTSPAPTDQLASFFVGSGSCTGNTLGKDMKSSHATTGKYTAERALDGHWVVVRYNEDQSAAAPKPFRVVQYFGYDAAKKRYVAVGVYNAAGTYSIGTSAGWDGDSIAFDEGDAGKPAAFRDTFTSGHGGFAGHTGMMRDKNGKWIKTDEETCTKT
ncbi:MAG TPA: DUF1579 family protein [Rhodanobacter sp.]|nr:DUF1579 family protein [Rhodanobacter sp.]